MQVSFGVFHACDRRDYSPATLLLRAGASLMVAGHDSAGRAVLEDALDRFRRLPLPPPGGARAGYKVNLAEALELLGYLEEARALHEGLAQESYTEPVRYQVMHRGPIGIIAAKQGERETALATLQWLAAQDDPGLKGLGRMYAAKIATTLGQYDEAIVLIQEALERGFSHP